MCVKLYFPETGPYGFLFVVVVVVVVFGRVIVVVCLFVCLFLRGESICPDTKTAAVKIEKVEINSA